MHVRARNCLTLCMRLLQALPLYSHVQRAIFRVARHPWTRALALVLGYAALILGPWAVMIFLYYLVKLHLRG